MINVLQVDLWLTHALQDFGQGLLPLMKFFTWLGYPQAYMIIIAIIYWSFDRKLGLRLAIFLPVVASLNSLLKQAFHAPRPYWVDPDVKVSLASNGFGMPSGHAQASTVWLYAASFLKKWGFWILAAGIVLMVGLSRVYLGVHFPSQVLLGWMTGILVLVIFKSCEIKFLTWFLTLRFTRQVLLIIGFTLLFLFLGGVILLLTMRWEIPRIWILNSVDELAGNGESILSSRGMSAIAGNSGGFLGTALGALLSHRAGGFHPGGVAWKRILRSITGMVALTIIYGIFVWISPEETEELLYSIWRFTGFCVISLTAIFLLPLLFKRLGLSN